MLFTSTPATARRTLEVFTTHICNPHTQKDYTEATSGFAVWCGQIGLKELGWIEPVHAAYVERLQEKRSPPSVKLNLDV